VGWWLYNQLGKSCHLLYCYSLKRLWAGFIIKAAPT
jgi:hypothetical protein